jgi:uncharacterized protein with FMN-binding domain
MKHKKLLIAFIVIIIIVGVAVISFITTMNKHISAYNNFDFTKIDLAGIPDGTYVGSEDGSLVKASVSVTVKDHIITQVKILSHDCGKGKPAEVIVDDIVKNNSLDVDAISGATFSSDVIKMAVYNALTQKQ